MSKPVRGYVAVRSDPHFVYMESLSDNRFTAMNNAVLRFGYLTHDEAQADGWRTEWAELTILTQEGD